MTTNGMRPIHPGEILREEFLQELDITPAALARALNVSAPTVNDIVRERRGITADMAIRLGRYFDTSAQFWMNLQSEYALATAYAASGEQIEHDIKPLVVLATIEAQDDAFLVQRVKERANEPSREIPLGDL
ncbi:virulence-associated protein [Pseudomonas sp. ATCC 13867]|nr:virulence-associated protein [Pseudomonas sp. ATCC 13867]RFQ26952.1 addiction module antidote protein, HigA family [Pseudomonas sp. ATCC 13867]